jgi:hypothetical protein
MRVRERDCHQPPCEVPGRRNPRVGQIHAG